ncbi:MAG: hypothetical protein IPF54_12595 [Draconibacterium sp.]|nr:hypothetical protein [Draconibacterium sp.]
MSEIKGNSKYGTDTLTLIAGAEKFNRWMWETIKPHCSGKILEIGAELAIFHSFL